MYPGHSMTVDAPVPAQFQCPISLELMIDPVTLTTGQTYDRGSIQRWFRAGKKTCPTTRQELQSSELIPNLTLQNYIRGWQDTPPASIHSIAGNAQDKVPSSPRLLTDRHVKRLLDDIRAGTDRVETLKLLRTMAKATERNRKMIVDGGALPLLSTILSSSHATTAPDYAISNHENSVDLEACEEALGVMAALSSNEDVKQAVGQAVGLKNLSTLSSFLRKGTSDAKMSAVLVLECLVLDDDSLLEVAAVDGLLPGVVGVLKADSYLVPGAVTAALRALYAICLPRKNRPKVIDAGAVAGVLELLPGARRTVLEGAVAILDLLSRCSQGREALCDHALSIPLVVKAIISQSTIVTEHAVKVLHSMLMFTANPALHALAVKHGVIRQLLMVIQCGGEIGTKHRAQDILKFLQITCGGDPCVYTINYSR